MSFKTIEQAPARLNRSELAVPGSQPKLCEKAAKSAADVIFLDLEDAVAPEAKVEARDRVCNVVKAGGYGPRELIIRVNGQDTEWGKADIKAAAKEAEAEEKAEEKADNA